MKINSKVKLPITWFWCIDVYFYALAFPIIQCVVNKQLNVALYAIPSLILSFFGGMLNLKITEKETMKLLYDKWFLHITMIDAAVWIGYFSLWSFNLIPDTWYPVACAIMHVSTVELSKAVRGELKNRLFPLSDDKTEFDNACGILYSFFNSLACMVLLITSLESFFLAKCILLVAMVVDNLIFLIIWWCFQVKRRT